MKLRDVGIVVRKELRETLRDRRTLTVMVLFPLVVYPLMSLLLTEVMVAKQSAADARMSRVSVVGADVAALQTVRRVLGARGTGIDLVGPSILASAGDDVADGRVDAVAELRRPAKAGAPPTVQIIFDQTREPSEKARARLETALLAALPVGCAPSFAVVQVNVAPKSKVGGFVLSKILPLIVVVMTMLGAFYPAIDITAGERERNTLETLLSSPVRRFDLMAGKVLAVAVLAALTGALNILSMSVTVAEGARLAAGGAAFAIPWTRAAATVLIVVPAAFLFGAVMVTIGAMARSFKEAQNLLAPAYLLCVTPSLVASVADLPLTGVTMLVPGTNLTLLARDLMLGEAHLIPTLVVLGATLGYGAAALAFAARLYDSERLLASTDADLIGLRAWLRHLLGHDGAAPAPPAEPSPAHAAAIFGVAFVLWFFVFTWLQQWRLIPGLLASQWVGFLGLVAVYARLSRRRLRDVLVFRRPRAPAVAGAVLLGLSGWVLLGVATDRLMPPPRELVEQMRKLIRPTSGDRSLGLSLFALALTPAICEEALFRGAILRGLRQKLPVMASCVLTGLLFGILHGDVWRFFPTAVLGALLSWVALTSGSIVPSMLVHFVNNGALVVLGYFGLDEAAEKLPPGLEILVMVAAALAFAAGLWLVRRGRDLRGGEARSGG